MITKVRLKNWRSHLDSELAFTKGVNCLVGNMGSGKTSVMQGISFALFGTFPSLQSRKLALADMIMRKPVKKDHAVVELEFAHDGDTYQVKRVVERRGVSQAEIRRNGRVLDVGTERVGEEVERILQMDYDLFSKAVFSEQDGMDYFLRIPKGQRMEHIDRMLKVDRFEKVREQAVSLSNRVRHGIEERMRTVSDMEKENLENKIKSLENEIKQFHEKSQQLKIELGDFIKKGEDIGRKVLESEEREQEMSEIKSEIDGLKARISRMNEETEKKTQFLKKKDPDSLGKEIKDTENEAEAKKAGLAERNKELSDLKARKRIVTESSEKLETLDDRCPLCDNKITKDKKEHLVSERKKELGSIEKEAGRLKAAIVEAEDLVKNLETSLRLKSMELDKIKTYANDIYDLKSDVLKHEERLKRFEGEMLEKEKGLDTAGLKILRKQLSEYLAEEKALDREIRSLNERAKDKEELLDETRKRESLLAKYKREIERDEDIVNKLSAFAKVMVMTQDQLREEFLRAVNSIMDDVWAELYPYGDFSGIRLAIDNDYVLQLRESSGWVSVEGIASGGERSLATLALRIAFSLAFIPNLKWLVLDEPTHNLDANAIRQFSEILREKMDLFAEQVFLVTHEEGLSNGITGCLYRMERDKEKDEPTRIVGL